MPASLTVAVRPEKMHIPAPWLKPPSMMRSDGMPAEISSWIREWKKLLALRTPSLSSFSRMAKKFLPRTGCVIKCQYVLSAIILGSDIYSEGELTHNIIPASHPAAQVLW